MKLLKRLYNIWQLGGQEVQEQTFEQKQRIAEKIQKYKQAEIIKMNDPLEAVLKKEE